MQLQSTIRIDIAWDTYLPDSLKESTREKRGKGVRRKVSGQTKLPVKWMNFLCDSKNKTEFFAFLTDKIAEFTFSSSKLVYVTSGQSVLHRDSANVTSDCNHEEADSRIVVHVLHALQQNMKIIEIRTVDTVIIVILAGVFNKLLVIQPLADIWVAFRVGKNYRLMSINAICNTFTPQIKEIPSVANLILHT